MEVTIVDVTLENIRRPSFEDDTIKPEPSSSTAILLGQIIKVTNVAKASSKKSKFNFSLMSLRNVGSFAFSSVKSIYGSMLISQHSKTKKYWDVIMECILAYNVATTLFFLAYVQPGAVMASIDLVCWIIFVINIAVIFFTEGISKKGRPVRKFKKISKHYLKSWFFFDVFAIIPLSAFGRADIEYYFRMVRLLKLPTVLDITGGTGISYLLTHFDFGKRDKNGKIIYSLKAKIIASFVKLFLVLIFIVYFLGCLWFWFQKSVNNYEYSSGYTVYNEENFADQFGLNFMSSEHVALRSSYFMLTTIATIGYGDFLPKNIYEMAFVSFIMLFGVTLFAVIMGNFNSAIAYYEESNSGGDYLGNLHSWLDSIERDNGKMHKLLRKQIIEHFSYYFSVDRLKTLAKNYWEAENAEDLIEISQDYVKDLPEESYYDILESLFHDFLTGFRFYFTESRFKLSIIPHLQPRRFLRKTYVLRNNEKIEDVIFVTKGNVSAGISINGKYEMLLFYEGGRTVLGDYNAITGVPNRFDIFAETIINALVIDAEAFAKILNAFYKEDKDTIMGIASVREINMKRLLNDHLKMAGIGNAAVQDLAEKYISKPMKDNFAGDQYSEEQVDSAFTQTVRFHSEISNRSLQIMRTLDSIRGNGISDFK